MAVLRRIQALGCEMLENLIAICKKHDIQFFLLYGSLLGAIRHHGFIPWDNDIDCVITRENIQKLYQYQEEFSNDYRLATADNGKYYDSIPRLLHKKVHARIDEDIDRYYDHLTTSWLHIDLFIMDKTYADIRGKWQRFLLAIAYGLLNAHRQRKFFVKSDTVGRNSRIMRIVRKGLYVVGHMFSVRWLRRRTEKIATWYNDRADANYYMVTNGDYAALHRLLPAEAFSKVLWTEFEGFLAPVPFDYDNILRPQYGDYMHLPPEEERVPHIGNRLVSVKDFVFEESEEMML